MPDPVFDQSDRVASPASSAPANMTSEQLRAHYEARERGILANAQRAIAEAAAGPRERATPAQSNEDFENNPLAATRETIAREGVTRTEWNQMTAAVQNNLIESAKFQASQGKKYWTRLASIVEQMAAGADPLSKLDASFWTTAYHAALGQHLATIQAEEAAAAQASASAEAPSGGSTPPPLPRVLTAKELAICEGLGLTPDAFRLGEERMRDNRFPVTLDNRRR